MTRSPPDSLLIANVSRIVQGKGNKMIDYTAKKIAELEREIRVSSVAPILDYDGWIKDDQPGEVSRQAGKLLGALGNGVASLVKKMKHSQDIALERPLHAQPKNRAPG